MLLGATKLLADTNSLQFAVGANPKKVSTIRVVLAPDDTYTVEFYRGRGIRIEKISEVDGLYVDQLHDTIEERTGLYATFRRRQAQPATASMFWPPNG